MAGTLNNWTGPTNINGGTLLIGSGTGTTSTAALLGTGVVNVGNGALTGALGGNGSINGTVTVTSTGHLAPAMSSSTFNTLTLNNDLTINAGGALDYNFGLRLPGRQPRQRRPGQRSPARATSRWPPAPTSSTSRSSPALALGSIP